MQGEIQRGNIMLNLIKKLSQKPRVAGSKRNKEIANSLANKLKKLNYQVDIKKYPFTGWKNLQMESWLSRVAPRAYSGWQINNSNHRRDPIRSCLFLGYCSNREWEIHNHTDETTIGLFQCPRKF